VRLNYRRRPAPCFSISLSEHMGKGGASRGSRRTHRPIPVAGPARDLAELQDREVQTVEVVVESAVKGAGDDGSDAGKHGVLLVRTVFRLTESCPEAPDRS
jgi:hypothetical protein